MNKILYVRDVLLRVIGKRALGEVRSNLMAVLAGDVTPHGVVARERTRAMRTRHPDALVPLPNMSSQIRLVSVKSLAIWTFQLFT